MTFIYNGVTLRTIKDANAEIQGYSSAQAAVAAAEVSLKAARKNHAAKVAIVQEREDEWAELVQKVRSGQQIEQNVAYNAKNAIPAAVVDVELQVEAVKASERELAAAKKKIGTVLFRALTPFLAQLQEDATEANRRLAVVRTEAWEKGQHADRLGMGMAMDPGSFTIELCKQCLGIS